MKSASGDRRRSPPPSSCGDGSFSTSEDGGSQIFSQGTGPAGGEEENERRKETQVPPDPRGLPRCGENGSLIDGKPERRVVSRAFDAKDAPLPSKIPDLL
jgi:hypothetical protein